MNKTPNDDLYAPLTPDQVEGFSDAIDEYQAQQRPWCVRLFDLPCFLAQVVRRRSLPLRQQMGRWMWPHQRGE
jgi:hypothetical protein